ncbi:MAG: hypothetical protein ABEH80_11240 [Halobaculum sp.]
MSVSLGLFSRGSEAAGGETRHTRGGGDGRRVSGLGGDAVHRECRHCGRNLPPERQQCDSCGGPAVAYDIR